MACHQEATKSISPWTAYAQLGLNGKVLPMEIFLAPLCSIFSGSIKEYMLKRQLGTHSPARSSALPLGSVPSQRDGTCQSGVGVTGGTGPRKCTEQNREREHLVRGRRRAGTKGLVSLGRRLAEWKQAECEPDTDAAAAFLAN